jgi:transketolase
MPCWELFREQDKAYQTYVLGKAPRIAVEAASIQGWHEWIGNNGAFIGMDSFGASAPAEKLFQHFGITVDAIVARAAALMSQSS